MSENDMTEMIVMLELKHIYTLFLHTIHLLRIAKYLLHDGHGHLH